MMYSAALETAAIVGGSPGKVFIGIIGDSGLLARYPIKHCSNYDHYECTV